MEELKIGGLYKIVEIHPDDSYSEDKHLIGGKVEVTRIEPPKEDRPKGFCGCNVVLKESTGYFPEERELFFFAVKLEKVN